MARQMAQITNLLKNALRIQPSPTRIPNDNQYTSSAPGTLVPNEDQPPSTPTPVPVPAAPPATVTDRSYSTTTSVTSSLPLTPHQPHPDPQVSMTAHSSTPLGDALFRTDPRPTLDTACENSKTTGDGKRYLTVTTPEAEPLEISASLEDQYVAVNYTSVRFPGWAHGGTHPVQIHTLDDPFHRSSRKQSLGIPVDPKANIHAPSSGCPLPGTGNDHREDRDFIPDGSPDSTSGTVHTSRRQHTLALPRGDQSRRYHRRWPWCPPKFHCIPSVR
jgi:hypothetical protein